MVDTLNDPPEGLLHGYRGDNIAIKSCMIVFSAIAWYNALELIILIFLTFHRYHGLYFWAMLLSAVVGVIPHAIGFLLEFFTIGPIGLAVTVATIGWYFMVPGQSFVLYSRLHLVEQSTTVLRRVFWLIIFSAIVMLIPTTILTYSTVYLRSPASIKGYNVMERMQLAWFCAQEILIASIYIFQTINLLRLHPEKEPNRHKIMYELIAINLIMILLDIALLVLEYIGLYSLQTTLKAAVYSVKLKLEFGVLGKLVSLVHTGHSDRTTSDYEEYPNFVNPTQLTGDVTHAAPTDERRRTWGSVSMDSLSPADRRGHPSLSLETSRPP